MGYLDAFSAYERLQLLCAADDAKWIAKSQLDRDVFRPTPLEFLDQGAVRRRDPDSMSALGQRTD